MSDDDSNRTEPPPWATPESWFPADVHRAVEHGEETASFDDLHAVGARPGDDIDRTIYPVDEWAIVERRFDAATQGRTETTFAVANGYMGMRANVTEGRAAHEHGTYINGFHETWPIRHAEEAFGFARVGQTIVNAPDAKVIRLYVDDEPFNLATAEFDDYERRLDFRTGLLTRRAIWRTPSGKRVSIRTNRLVSFTERHLAVLDYEVELLDDDAAIVFSSQLLNRQDGTDEYRSSPGASGVAPANPEERFDPRKAEQMRDRVLQPRFKRAVGDRLTLGYRTMNSGMTIACAIDHRLTVGGHPSDDVRTETELEDDLAKRVFRLQGRANTPIHLTKFVAYHTAYTAPARELADRCHRTLERACETPLAAHRQRQREWLDDFWDDSDVVLHGHPDLQQAMRWNLFQVAQAAARGDGLGIAAKGVTGSGYGGHYFWDTEIFVLPFLTYTQPRMARNALRFRCTMLDAARRRAIDLNERGALFPWRTINGEESSAYYAASTAQYHIDADIAHAMAQYTAATGDTAFLINDAIDVLVETARMWEDLGFWRRNDIETFHIHGVTGPDEYTTVVNDNLFTNVMAQQNLHIAVDAVEWLKSRHPVEFDRLAKRLDLQPDEVREWRRAATHMHIPFDAKLRVHPQDASFLDKEVWDLERTPASQRPLLLNFHPLVIYRFQVIKQADVVLALLLRGDRFTPEEKLRNFEYYDVLTTGDSSLSAVVQSIIAAEVGHMRLAERYFRHAAYVDLADMHGNADAGVHVASAGGMWLAAVAGLVGMRDYRGAISFDPRLPDDFDGIDFTLRLRGSRVRVALRRDRLTFTIDEGGPAAVSVRGQSITIEPGSPKIVELDHQGDRRSRQLGIDSITGAHRADGTVLTASVPVVTGSVPLPDHESTGAPVDYGTRVHPRDGTESRGTDLQADRY